MKLINFVHDEFFVCSFTFFNIFLYNSVKWFYFISQVVYLMGKKSTKALYLLKNTYLERIILDLTKAEEEGICAALTAMTADGH